MTTSFESDLKEQVLAENRRVHSLENAQYLLRHPEQTNVFQLEILQKTLGEFDRHLARLGGSVLDVGCGTGYLYLPLMERGYSMTGVDISDTLIDVLQERIPADNKACCRLVTEDIEAFLENDAGAYDGIVCSALLHHLYDYESVVHQLAGKLNRGGVLLIFFEPLKQRIDSPVRFKLHRALGRLDEWFYERNMKRQGIPLIRDDYEVADFQRQFGGIDPDRLASRIKESGLEILAKHTFCARRNAWAAWLANRALSTHNTFNILAKKI